MLITVQQNELFYQTKCRYVCTFVMHCVCKVKKKKLKTSTFHLGLGLQIFAHYQNLIERKGVLQIKLPLTSKEESDLIKDYMQYVYSKYICVQNNVFCLISFPLVLRRPFCLENRLGCRQMSLTSSQYASSASLSSLSISSMINLFTSLLLHRAVNEWLGMFRRSAQMFGAEQ